MTSSKASTLAHHPGAEDSEIHTFFARPLNEFWEMVSGGGMSHKVTVNKVKVDCSVLTHLKVLLLMAATASSTYGIVDKPKTHDLTRLQTSTVVMTKSYYS